jgi:hypothetical protein
VADRPPVVKPAVPATRQPGDQLQDQRYDLWSELIEHLINRPAMVRSLTCPIRNDSCDLIESIATSL